jgi:hypothetical protein
VHRPDRDHDPGVCVCCLNAEAAEDEVLTNVEKGVKVVWEASSGQPATGFSGKRAPKANWKAVAETTALNIR